ncbi:hypothetical protein DAEQUDRAFT_754423 [Daedalea quercina L-15889]|uniref:DUF6533 domain-containing protein n=1 Tax=Daedalea quercina L-15889 TaxID=1314783 RepID=A0A165TKU9_9APHY|nr:hypothetical protein DAEQUDRAFT_754423 [Daedalea quercina L-15889]
MMSVSYESAKAFTWDTYFVQNCCTAATFSVYLYDRLLTFSREVDVIWRLPTRSFSCLYAALHVSAILYFAANIATWAGLDCQRDRLVYPVYAASWCTLSTLLAVITALRIYGVNCCVGRRWLVPAVVFALFLPSSAFAIVSVLYTFYQPTPYPIRCLIDSTRFFFTMRYEIIVRACSIVADSVVLLVTWRATYPNYKQARGINLKTPILLTQQLLKDGTLHFLVLLVLNVVVLSSWALNALECSMFVDIFVIGIREASSYNSNCPSTPSQMSDLYFLDPNQPSTPEPEDGVLDLADNNNGSWDDDYFDNDDPVIHIFPGNPCVGEHSV